jgi:hypothetical protein
MEAVMPSSRLLYLLSVLFIATPPLSAQPYRVPLIATTGGVYADTLWFGLHPAATDCIDSVLGEYELPPCPPVSVFDMRFADPRWGNPECYGQGIEVDIRSNLDPARTDTFRVRFQPGENGFPVTFSWPQLSPVFQHRMVLQDPFGGTLLHINMRAQGSVAVDETGLSELLIIAGGPFVDLAPEVITALPHQVSYGSAALTGTVVPHGNESEAWFEWGGSPAFGNSTPPVGVGAGSIPVFLAQHVQGIYSGTHYYRLVVENDWGRVYGQTRSFLSSSSSFVQTMIGLTVSDTAGHDQDLWAGIHPSATGCMDLELAEFFMPPLPPAAMFDARFTDPRNTTGSCFDAGLGVDFRRQYPAQQADTFQITVQANPADYPLRFSWGPELTDYVSPSLRLLDAYGGLAINVDMRTQQSAVVMDPAIRSFRIVAGASFLFGAPAVLTYPAQYVTGSSAQFRGAVNPRGSSTQCRFEWGTTTGYGHTTPWQSVGGDTSLIGLSQTMLGLTTATEYHYRVSAENAQGSVSGPEQAFTTDATTDVDGPAALPAAFALFQNYPNPFNPQTMITFGIPAGASGRGGRASLRVHDMLGREVSVLWDGEIEPGRHSLVFDAAGLPSGVYVCRLIAGGGSASMKMVLLR